jgi:LPS-assembly lipoprotein
MSWFERTQRAAGTERRERALRRRAMFRGALIGGAALAPMLLAGCGFALRLPPKLGFASLAMTGFEPRSPLAADLKRAIAAQVPVLDDPNRADVILHALTDQRQKSVVASTAAAQVRELQLRVRFEFRVATPTGRELMPRVQLQLSRDMSYSETFALAKEHEEAELFRDMHADVVLQVMRRLASIKVG